MLPLCCLEQGELQQLLSLLKTTKTLTEQELGGLSILMSDFLDALARVQPSAKREGFATVPDVTWENVGALQNIREELTMAILVNRFRFCYNTVGKKSFLQPQIVQIVPHKVQITDRMQCLIVLSTSLVIIFCHFSTF